MAKGTARRATRSQQSTTRQGSIKRDTKIPLVTPVSPKTKDAQMRKKDQTVAMTKDAQISEEDHTVEKAGVCKPAQEGNDTTKEIVKEKASIFEDSAASENEEEAEIKVAETTTVSEENDAIMEGTIERSSVVSDNKPSDILTLESLDVTFDRKLAESVAIKSILSTQAKIVACQTNILQRMNAIGVNNTSIVADLQLGSGIIKSEMPETVKAKLGASVKYRFGQMKFLDNDMLQKNEEAILKFLYDSVGINNTGDKTQVSRELIRQARHVIGQYRADVTAEIKTGALCK
jgi:hypothetical protein